MAVCSECGSMFFVGGVKIGARKFCSARCAEKGKSLLVADTIPAEDVRQIAEAFFNGPCPKCGKEGKGIDIRRDHRLISALVVQHFSNRRYVCCRPCALKEQAQIAGQTFLLGWWSPRGIFMTPFWLAKNFYEMGKTARRKPSSELRQLLARETAAEILAGSQISPYPRYNDKDMRYEDIR